MGRYLIAVRRAFVLLAVWAFAICISVKSVSSFIEYRALASEVAELESQYDCQLTKYASLLAQGQRIENDPQCQIDILKGKLGYAEPDEIPIVIVQEAP